jgi:hypothetical protein
LKGGEVRRREEKQPKRYKENRQKQRPKRRKTKA